MPLKDLKTLKFKELETAFPSTYKDVMDFLQDMNIRESEDVSYDNSACHVEISTDEIHPHCLQCVRLQKCSVTSLPGESCHIINCPSDCGARFHACKLKEHKLLCMNEKVPCINAEYGCPAFMCRKYQSKHLISCPASIIHCSEEWDRWPIHFHDKKTRYKNNFDSSLLDHLDVALAMRDQRMLRRWCNAAAQGQSVADQKFTISPSSSLWIFRKWQSSREYSYPPGLEQSVCNELCKACKNGSNSSSNSLTHCKNSITRTGTVLDSFCLDYNALAEKENAGDSNNKQEKPENNHIIKENIVPPLKTSKPSELPSNIFDFPQYNLDDVLQLSQFGTIIYHSSSGEGSIRVAVDPADSFANTCFDHQNVACQILDFKFRNPSSTPPWCLPLGLDLNLESRSQHPPSNFMYTFLCSQEFRRDEYGWHYKNAHSEIHGGLNGWLVQRCPLAQYGCKFARQRFRPSATNSYLVYNEVLESFGVASSVNSTEECDKFDTYGLNKKNCQNGFQGLNLVELPYDVLQHIVLFLDSFSLANLSLTCLLLRDVCSSVLKDRGLVHFKWERHKKDGKYSWKPSKYKRWFFSSHFTPVHKWTFDDKNNMANHLKECTFYNRISPKYPFDYMKGPIHVHPNPEKCFADPSKENSTTKL